MVVGSYADIKNVEDLSKEPSVAFLAKDYEYACSQMKYYDGQMYDYMKYLFTAYAAIISIVGLLDKLGVGSGYFLLVAELLLFTGFSIGVILALMIMTTRMYFVVVARYANTLRQFFLKRQKDDVKYGFSNDSGMWDSPSIPHYAFSLSSAHTWIMLVPVFLNSMVFGVLVYLYYGSSEHAAQIATLAVIVIAAVQIILMWLYSAGKIPSINNVPVNAS